MDSPISRLLSSATFDHDHRVTRLAWGRSRANGDAMTVCLAATCHQDGAENAAPAAVVAADRMVTLGGFIEFEHAVPKMAHPSANAVAMIAGDTLVGMRLAQEVADGFQGSMPSAEDIARALAARYADVRLQQAEEALLRTRGLDVGRFYQLHQQLNPQITMMLDNSLANFNLGVELLLAGVDANGAHIYSVANPGVNERKNDVIGYAAIGSGAIHALQAMIGFGHHGNTSLKETVFRVYAAKRRAEVAPGVGHDTDLAIVTASSVTFLTKEQLHTLEDAYQAYEASTKDALTSQLNDLTLSAATTEERTSDDGDTDAG